MLGYLYQGNMLRSVFLDWFVFSKKEIFSMSNYLYKFIYMMNTRINILNVAGVANMASYAISSNLILVIHDNMIIGTNLIVLACLCRHF
jgi:hypothetical protein